ncbi:Fatty-acid-CoA ligase-like protein [Enterobacter sp. FY-07]|nr:Fatty-acid-CoA ligase-like protein [Enterobacter sp. FY-07]
MRAALEAFCLMTVESCAAQRRKPRSKLMLINHHEAIRMPEQHQDSLLPAARQGGVNHENSAKHSSLVRIYGVFHTRDIHLADTKITVRDPLQG